METRAVVISEDSPEESASYSVISYASNLPSNYTNMILSRWLKSLRLGNDYFKLIDKESYFLTYEKYIKSILAKPSAIVKLAVLTNDKDTCFGWAVIEGTALHYVHIHEDYRRQGISNHLIPKDLKYCTHLTKQWLEIWPKKYKDIKFNPFYVKETL